MKKLYYLAAVAAGLLNLSSCLKDQADIFDQPASARMAGALESARNVLASAPQGWWVAYYPDLSLGGYVMTLEFTTQKVTARSEVFPGEVETSGFNMISDDGPVLSFDVNNKILHYFSTPSSSEYQAKGGDFEFIILKATADSVCLKGKRSGNEIKLYPLEKPAQTYLDNISEISKNMVTPSLNTTIAGGMVHVDMDLNYRQFSIGRKDADEEEIETVPYVMTENGIKLYQPVTMYGTTFQNLTFAEAQRTLSCGDLVLEAEPVPAGYTFYEDYIGPYSMKLGSRSFDVNVAQGENGKTLLIKGLNDAYDFTLDYDKNTGGLRMQLQYLLTGDEDSDDPYGLYLVPMTSNNYLATSDKDGASSSWTDDSTLTFTAMSYRSASFRLLEYHPYDDEYTWHSLSERSYRIGGSIDSFPIPFTMTKK